MWLPVPSGEVPEPRPGSCVKDTRDLPDTGKSLSEALLFAEHGEKVLCTNIVLNVRNNSCTQHVLPML